MNEFESVDSALKSMQKDIEKATPKVLLAWSIQFAKDTKQDYIAFQDGYLGDSALKTPKSLMQQGTVMWTTPYARRRYYQNYKTPESKMWDVKTFNKNKATYEKQFATQYNEDIF